jgi:hypothetical protein
MNTKSSPVTMTEPPEATPPVRTSMLRSTLLLFLSLFPVNLIMLVFHEGGHALYTLALGGSVSMLYVHPFSLPGYSRPLFLMDHVWYHFSGPALVLSVSLLVFILCWKRRSVSFLPLLMFFPWTWVFHSFSILMIQGDFANIMALTGISPIVFRVTGSILAAAGIFFFVSLFPLLGLAPRDLKSLFVVPAALFLWALVGLIIGYLFVSGSPIDGVYGLGEEILSIVKVMSVVYLISGVIIAGIYVTLYRWIYLRLPAWLRTNTVQLTWKDLRLPALLAAVSVVSGLIIIT